VHMHPLATPMTVIIISVISEGYYDHVDRQMDTQTGGSTER